MIIICQKGFYKFFPQEVLDISIFKRRYGVDLVECEDYFTFKVLAELPNYSFVGHPYSGLLGTVNYAGNREEVMAENGYTFYQKTQTLVPKNSFIEYLNYDISNYIVSQFLPQPFAFDKNKKRITGFSGLVDLDFMKYKIERFFYENI
jgi:hypothetical protein